jgi:hypothetical protein
VGAVTEAEAGAAGGAGGAGSEDPTVPQLGAGADAVLPITVGTLAWAVALVVLLAMRSRLDARGDGWWIWVAVSGLLLGGAGSLWVRRRRAAYQQAAARRHPGGPGGPGER